MKNAFWPPEAAAADTHVAFRTSFEISTAATVEIQTVGSAWYHAWLDGEWLLEGPLRYAHVRPEYDVHRVDLARGRHVLAFHATHIGANTRMLIDTPPFLWCRLLVDGDEVPLAWRAIPLDAYRPRIRRINPLLGWMEDCATQNIPTGWKLPDFDDASWPALTDGASALPEPQRADLANVLRIETPMHLIGRGTLATTFGYPNDDPPVTFFLRELNPTIRPAKGQWRLYDLGRVRLGAPELVIDAPAGTVVEIAAAEFLTNGRVSPWITLSTGPSCNLDRHCLAGGRQVISPLTPKGGRFIEVHIFNNLDAVVLGERFFERTYHEPTAAEFKCGDPLLEQIWLTGIETYRACAEDALIDNPTRERGQWIGDVVTVGLGIAAVAYHDVRLVKRALEQAALSAREDGLVSGLCPGGSEYLPTYSFQWIVAVMNYHALTGNDAILKELYPAAQRNLAAAEAFLKDDGLHPIAGWNFIDWGYQAEEPVDLACNLHYLWALHRMIAWTQKLGLDDSHYRALARHVEGFASQKIAARLTGSLDELGYHCVALSLVVGIFPADHRAAALDYLKAHILNCFPNNPDAPRNDTPLNSHRQLISPYFAHYVFPLLIETGEMDFVLDQYRICWGWMLGEGRTTWIELFDTNWSHCHQWAGCPTWQLTRYLSGLHPGPDESPEIFDWKFHPGSLPHASLKIPHPSADTFIHVEWKRAADEIIYRVETSAPIGIRGLPGEAALTTINQSFEHRFKS